MVTANLAPAAAAPAAAMASPAGDAELIPQDAPGPAIQVGFDPLRATAGR
jgi:hypothetical protein